MMDTMNFANIEFFDSHDGSHTLFSKDFGYTYHSKFGAVQESQHIFLEMALRFKAAVQTKINIIDIGFGTGLNAYLTYLEAVKRNLKIHYTAIELYPVDAETVAKLNYSAYLGEQSDQKTFEKMHSVSWNEPHRISPQFTLEKRLTSIAAVTDKNTFDIIYFDAFAPDAQPELWATPVLQNMYDSLKKDGILVTYCAKGQVRRDMKSVGFFIEKIPGPPGKREMTRATK
jgi:tRNA U34 5-methylaminomethyl-2-thiouridine-forming methyltransferase MnmC